MGSVSVAAPPDEAHPDMPNPRAPHVTRGVARSTVSAARHGRAQ
jgi:hypothetical protein